MKTITEFPAVVLREAARIRRALRPTPVAPEVPPPQPAAEAAEPDEAPAVEAAADEHLAAAMPHLSGDYMGEHWLASFALLALLPEG